MLSAAMVKVATIRKHGIASRSALELQRIINGKAWEHMATVFQQLRNIGPKSMRVLGGNGIHSTSFSPSVIWLLG